MKVKLLSSTENFIKVIATAARVCYSGLPLEELLSRYSEEDDISLIKRVVGMGHLSVVEHAVFTFEVDRELKEELFKILMEKPYLKISERESSFIVSLNLRTALELISEMPELEFVNSLKEFIPGFLIP
ncbi:Thymidylate synthase complementing protein [Balnearium lithotrophicum]|uniref:Thymidylate synthase complementing protein n=1 Tax=Balnearium lithotrophicum TaxID=223788 RepID=A0A521AM62_9BACT|nr:FAD-dependent thymidylate synthase [Balnearium lithotrophicum]SMO35924.1 Thymidylate synthase complementing protein [Balnearium lithotrophicum]